MGNLRETNHWEAGIYQIETSDPVMGGENGISNRPIRQLANRTLWLKNQIADAVSQIGSVKRDYLTVSAANTQLAAKADKNTQFTAGSGLTGGGSLSGSRTIAMGRPSKITATSINAAVSDTHSHEIDKASTTVAGIVKLNNTLSGSSESEALTAKMGKKLQDEKLGNSGSQTLDGQLTITRPLRVNNPTDWNALEMASGDGCWVLETSPNGSADRRFQFKFVKSGDTTLYVRFPQISANEKVAYQSWVAAEIGKIAAGKAAVSHNHAIADISGLQTALNGKLGTSGDQTMTGMLTVGTPERWGAMRFPAGEGSWRLEFHPSAALNTDDSIRFNLVFEQNGRNERYLSFPSLNERSEKAAYQSWVSAEIGKTAAGKADRSHNHALADISGLQSALNGKAAASHTHSLGEIRELQSALNGRVSKSGDDTISGNKTFNGNIYVPTKSASDNSQQAASTAFVQTLVGRSEQKLRSEFAAAKSQNGYTKLPNGLIMQWGVADSREMSGTVNFPIAFPRAVFMVNLCEANQTASGRIVDMSWIIGNTTTSQFAWRSSDPIGAFAWFAIGH